MISIIKPKIPRNYSYLLRTSQLRELLTDNDIITNIDLVYWLPQKIGSVLEAHFWLPNKNIPYNRVYVRAGALLKSDAKIAREQLISVVFPAFVEWIKACESSLNNSALMQKSYFNAIFSDKNILIVSK